MKEKIKNLSKRKQFELFITLLIALVFIIVIFKNYQFEKSIEDLPIEDRIKIRQERFYKEGGHGYDD